MDSFELNKMVGAVLFALLVSFGLSIASETIFETDAPEAPGYMIAVAASAEGHGEGGEAPAERPHIATLLANADPAAGEAAAKKCGTCHTFGEGEANKVGPNLYGVVMRPIASHPGYEYSPSMVAYAAEAKVWDYDHLDAFLHSPAATVPKTKMAFPGLKNDPERANVIAYMRTLAASPAPLPEAPAVTAAAEATTATDAGPAEATAEIAPAATAAAEEAPADGAAPAAEPPATAADVAGVAAQDPATNDAAPVQPAGAAAEQPAITAEQPAASSAEQQAAALAEQPAPAEQQPAATEQQGGAAGGEQVAAVPSEGASEGGTNPQVSQPQGTLGPIDSTTADQQGAVPQVAPIEQPAPEPSAEQAAQRPAEPAQPAAEQQAAQAPAQAEQPAAPADATAPAAEQQVAQTEVPAEPAAPAAEPAAAEQPTAAAPAAPAAGGAASGFAALVAAADVKKGQTISKRCAACHAFEKGGANKIGPVLWDVVNRPIASVPDFEYSEAMKAFSEGGQKLWTVDELSAYLENPKGHIPGNKMAFPGLKKEDDRANLIGYLHTLSDNPAPLQ
jgi:cytochrome c